MLNFGLTVLFGLWVGCERQGFDYDDSKAVQAQLERFTEIVKTYKDHPAILIEQDEVIKNPIIQFQATNRGTVYESTETEYLEDVAQFINATQTDFTKIIFSRIQSVPLLTADLFPLFETLQATYPDTFVYLVNIPKIGCWMGASPEIFITQNHQKTETVALAGTQLDLGISLDAVAWGDKEIEEQAMVERYIEKLLKKQQFQFKKTGPQTIRAGKVLHLKTHFEFLSETLQYNFIKALHPTPAVCGLPKDEARQYIIDNEPHERAYYCGFLGPINMQQTTNLYVNLRCMQVFKDKFALYLGGGITADSDAKKEWEETEMKAKTLADVIERVYLQEFYEV